MSHSNPAAPAAATPAPDTEAPDTTAFPPPDPQLGLSADEAARRHAQGLTNTAPPAPVRTLREIAKANILTPVNAIMLSLFVLIMVAWAPGDALFVGVVFSNSVIGIVQEVRAKKELEKLAILNAPKAVVVRDGEPHEIEVADIVAGEVLDLAAGRQIVVDGEVLAETGLEVDESLLTGESDPVDKPVGAAVMSGSFVSAGNGRIVATRIGAEAYASTLAEEARRFTLVDSELRNGINWILRILVWLVPPASALLLWALLGTDSGWQEALRGAVGAAVAMVPDGLVLLTSMAFVVGVITLARRKALAKELATVELLAHVDVLCLDKTGTITTGEISFGAVDTLESAVGLAANAPVGYVDYETPKGAVNTLESATSYAEAALGAFAAADPNPNATLAAVKSAFDAPAGWVISRQEPFSSARKWAGVEFAEQGSFYLGAPEILLAGGGPAHEAAMVKVTEHAEAGSRVLALCQSASALAGSETTADHAASPAGSNSNSPANPHALPADLQPVALVLLVDTIRPDAGEILDYFHRQGVALKVISGDNVATVSAVAQRAGIPQADQTMDARELPDDEAELTARLAEVMADTVVFGRVKPHQKRAMVAALQQRGHTVAMTGDGVNDVLALKDSNIGIAMGSGSEASRSVAQIVLLDNSFATLPKVLSEGRKVINNIERVANLFISKAVYAVIITAVIGFMSLWIANVEFPFLPRHLTLTSTFSIGLPGILLALAPSESLVRPGFLWRVLKFSVPAGVVAAAGTLTAYEIARQADSANLQEARTVAVITLLGLGLFILLMTARPLKAWKVGLVAAMAGLYALVVLVDLAKEYFELYLPPGWLWLPMAVIVAVGGALITVWAWLTLPAQQPEPPSE